MKKETPYIRNPKAKEGDSARRRCLYCCKDFDSSHIGNRICKGCMTSVNKRAPGLV